MSATIPMGQGRPVTTTALRAMKAARRPIVMVTAYDAPSARLVDAAGVDAILVGDSLGMVVLGHDSTLPVTMEDMLHHTRAVVRGARRALVIADMPFMSFQVSAVSTASRVVPGTGLTMARSWPSRRFSNELLPTLGRPTMAMRIDSSSSAAWSKALASGR